MYRKSTNDIIVSVQPVFIDERSDPENGQYFWAYRVQITNESSQTVQLINRYWHITDANGHIEEVAGEGVVGEQPVLEPRMTFEYTSGCPLRTPSGIMVGHYELKCANGELIRAEIPAFSLDLPHADPVYN
ncbi:MAG: Co2+/Mg2+ efflux protein ApaG [Salaquimonas sp.]